ncbi:MAG: hypothetical protein JWO77_3210 [Ilumatobacteraceae bacterium]|nr:hypothetical protein [Ilumatobacteraceae bacterium]
MTFARPSTRAVAATLIAAAIGILAPACSSGGSDAAKGTTTAVVKATTTTGAVTTTGAATTAAPAAPTGLPDQEAAATKLYDAWVADDRVSAATVADQAAIDNIWPAAKGDYSLYNSCSTGEFDTSGCLFRGANGTIQIDLEKRGGNWVVAGAFWSEP